MYQLKFLNNTTKRNRGILGNHCFYRLNTIFADLNFVNIIVQF